MRSKKNQQPPNPRQQKIQKIDALGTINGSGWTRNRTGESIRPLFSFVICSLRTIEFLTINKNVVTLL
jgi:hypothetical protein